jgi:hypothetical protein
VKSISLFAVTTALRRKLEALREMTEQRGCTPAEAAAARLAEQRIAKRLGMGLDALEPPEQYPVAPERRRTRGRRKTSAERAHQERLHVGAVIDCTDYEGTWRRCRCGGSRFEVMPGIGGHAGLLRCCRCSRNGGWLRREHFQPGGRHL